MSAITYRPDIQGLRAIAVLAVILFHFNPAWLPGGFVGVDVFLVISGFLITSILLHKKNRPDYRLAGTLRYFYSSRLKRIVPAYFAVLVLVSLLAAVLFLPQDFAIYRKGLNSAAYFNSNNFFAGFGDYFAPANHEQPLLHTWSLAVEIQFYLLVPLLVLLAPPKVLKWLFAALLFGLTAVAEYRLRVLGIQQATYYSLYARLPEFFAGGLVVLIIYTGLGRKTLVRRARAGLGAGLCRRAAPARSFSWFAGAAACGGCGARPAASGEGDGGATAVQQTHGLAGRIVVFALSVALAGLGPAALLHRLTGAGRAV